jgi:anthranilate/para-aminobenzoate synthase component II
VIVEAFGGEIGQAKRLVHGKPSEISHDGRGLFVGLPQPFEAGRYHSLAATRVRTASSFGRAATR